MKNLQVFLKRFLQGSTAGLFCGLVAWGYSAFAYVTLSPLQVTLGLLFTAISCGTIVAITDFDNFMKHMPLF